MRPGTRILIVDDEPNARVALSELLRDEGYEVASDDGASAQARLDDFHPDVLLTDAQMPALVGAPAVVVMSARPQPIGSATPFVGKPIDIDHLLRTVEGALGRR